MKKTLLFSALAVATSLTAGAKTADELRVYINPGHGSWTANDRPNPLVGHGAYSRTNTDTTNFFETNTNLRKGFGVLERLIDYGLKFDRTLNQTGERWQIGAARDMSNNIVMSHVKCGPYHDDNGTVSQLGDAAPEDIYYYNRNLTEICEEVEANNFDMFISIHSNAATEGTTTNYPLFLYRGYDTPKEEEGVTLAHQEISRKMADACWDYAIGNPHAVWTAYKTSKNLRGDINFYGSSSTRAGKFKGYLGVLKHSAPGFLVEGYFHTYQPARHRAMNWDVSRVEGIAYARGIADYFGLAKEKFGTIYGIVRDQHEKFRHDYYSPNPASDDIFLPINGCKVTLKKDGKVVAEYTTDNQYNGAYVFDRVEPGKYTLEFSHPDYKAADPVEVEVKAAADTYPSTRLENVNWVPPTVEYTDYPDPAAKIAGREAASEYAFAATYTDEPIAELEGKIVRRSIVRDGKMYILAIDKLPTYAQVVADAEKPVPTIIVYDLNNKKVLANVSTEGAYGSIQNIADIQLTADNVLVGGNQTKCQYSADYVENLPDGTKEPRGTWTLYRWENDENGVPTGKPQAWITNQGTGRWYRAYVGGTFAYSGTSTDGNISVPAPSITAPNYMLRSENISIINGEKAGVSSNTSPNNIGEAALGDGYRFTTSPLDADKYVINGKDATYIGNFKAADAEAYTKETAGAAKVDGAFNIFKYAGVSYMAAADQADGKNVGVRLVDISKDVDNAKAVSTVNTTLEGVDAKSVAAAGEVEATIDPVDYSVLDAWINLYVLRDGKLTKLTTKNVTQPAYKSEYAYGLGLAKNGSDFDITYMATGDAQAATLVLTPTSEGDVVRVALPAPVKGQNTYTLTTADVPAGSYNWAIEIASKPSPTANEVFADIRPEGDTRGGAVVITDPAQASFGYTVVSHGKAAGIDIYNPAGEKVATRVWKDHKTFGGAGNTNQSDPFRGHEREGKAVLAGWGDKSEGLIVVDPLQEQEPFGMYAGTKQGNGNHILDGVNLGGGVAGFCFVGEGENTKLFSFSEDHENQNGGGSTENSIVRYDLGDSWTIDKAPVVIGYKSMLANQNVEMLGYGNGFFAAQVRGAGNNAESVPGFFYYSLDEEDVVFNSGTIKSMDNGNSGIAITVDGKKVAVGETGRIAIYDVEWNDGKPALTYSTEIPMTKSIGWSQMRFDYAGNLHAYLRENGGYHVYAMKNDNPVVLTPAPAQTLIAIGTGVEDVAVDAAEAEGDAVYYNMNGIQVPAENLVPGVYVKVVGKTSTKVVVK